MTPCLPPLGNTKRPPPPQRSRASVPTGPQLAEERLCSHHSIRTVCAEQSTCGASHHLEAHLRRQSAGVHVPRGERLAGRVCRCGIGQSPGFTNVSRVHPGIMEFTYAIGRVHCTPLCKVLASWASTLRVEAHEVPIWWAP